MYTTRVYISSASTGVSAKGITPRQRSILEFLMEYVETNGFPPAVREIGARFELKALRGVTCHLDALERKGFIVRGSQPRCIQIIRDGLGLPTVLRFTTEASS